MNSGGQKVDRTSSYQSLRIPCSSPFHYSLAFSDCSAHLLPSSSLRWLCHSIERRNFLPDRDQCRKSKSLWSYEIQSLKKFLLRIKKISRIFDFSPLLLIKFKNADSSSFESIVISSMPFSWQYWWARKKFAYTNNNTSNHKIVQTFIFKFQMLH